MENQKNLMKPIQSIDGNHSEMFSTQLAQSDTIITPRHYFKNYDPRKSFTIERGTSFSPWKI